MTAIDIGGSYLTQAVQRDPSMVVPGRGLVIRIIGHDPADPLPHKAYEKRIFDPVALTLTDRPEPVAASVYDYQFIGQAADEKIITDEEADEWIGNGVIPNELLDAIKKVVPEPERQRRVILFMKGTTSFPRNHELTPLLAGLLGKDTPEKIDAFFVSANKR